MRVSVVGTTGSGKTTFDRALAEQLGLPYIEMDALNWQTGWRDLSRTDPDEFVRQVSLAIAQMPGCWIALTASFATSSGDEQRILSGSITSGA